MTLFDKGRGAGGRMSARRVVTDQGDASFDHGAQYFTARDPDFRVEVEQWQRAGCAAPWPAAGEEAWVGVPAMNAPVKLLAGALDVHWNVQVAAIERVAKGWIVLADAVLGEFDAMVVAIPAEQAGNLLASRQAGFAALAKSTVSEPCWTLMAAFTERLPVMADIIRDDPVIGWAARNSAKPGRVGPESWVVQASADWSRRHLEQSPAEVAPLLLRAFACAIGTVLPSPSVAFAHRWRYAKSGAAGRAYLWTAEYSLGVCGDWLLGPRVECAWLSGSSLATAIIRGLTG